MRLYRGIFLIFITLLACSASAARIAAGDAENVARAFSRSGRRLDAGFGDGVSNVRRHVVKDGVPFFSVRMKDRGTVFVSEENGPVVAFTSSSVDFDNLDSVSPLRVLLERDAQVRANIAALGLNPKSPYYSDNTNCLAAVDEIRVAPLVKSKWSQDKAGGHNCYNYYTPNNYVCGCTATATAQIMRYFEYPAGSVTAKSFACTVDGSSKTLTMQGGTYDWPKMTLSPGYGNYNDESWSAIGKLTSDVGIALGSEYTSGGSSAEGESVPGVLTEVFGYRNAVMYGCDDVYWDAVGHFGEGDGLVHGDIGLHNRANRQNMICANLDAGLPVLLGIYGYATGYVGDHEYHFAGHAIVGDGYGYCDVGGEKVPYLHINMGWGGVDDAWYNVPEICTSKTGAVAADGSYDFTIFYGCAGNIFTNQTGEIVSGRVLDTNGVAVASAEVSIDGIGTAVTAENGIYSFIVPANSSQEIQAVLGSVTGVVSVTVGTTSMTTIGNRWGTDVLLGFDIRERTTPTNFYVSASFGIDEPQRGTCDAPYATIQYAITNGQNLVNGDVIHVGPGTYYGCVETPATSISIVSTDGPEFTILDGEGLDCCYYGNANQQNVLSGFTVTNGAYYGGIFVGTATNCIIVNCVSSAQDAGSGGGACGAFLYDCVLHNNDAYYGGGAAYSTLVNCTVYDNWAYYSGGGVDYNCAVTNSIVWRNWATKDDVEDNWEQYQDWYGGVYLPSFAYSCTYPDGFTDLGGNITNDPKCVSFNTDDWRLRVGSPCVGTALGGLNMGAWQGEPVEGYVINAEAFGRGTVSPWSQFVLPGESATFVAEGDHPFLAFETNGVFVTDEREYVWTDIQSDGTLSAFFGVTNYFLDAVSGDDTNDGLSWEAPLKSIYAMTQKAGSGDSVRVKPGVYDSCSWCVYGVEVESTDGAEATIIDGGGTNRCVYAPEMLYRGFTFRNGAMSTGYGGGAYYGTFVDCVFSNCTAAFGGAAAGSSLTNCLVVGNSAARYRSAYRYVGGQGGGVYECDLVNCTLSDNTAYSLGGGAYLHTMGQARNSIVCGNTCTSGSANGNDVYGNNYWTMSNSLSDVDAKFRDPANGDYRLTPSSPALDAGSMDFVCVDHDLAGTNRVWGRSVDIGCYEYHLPAGITDPTVIGVAAALTAEGYRSDYAAAVTTPKDYAYLVEWTASHALTAAELNASSTGFVSPGLNADGLINLDPTNIVLQSFVPSTGGVWSLALSLPGYDRSRINIPLLKSALGIVGSSSLTGSYTSDDLSLVVTPSSTNILVTIVPPVATNYFMKATVR